MIVLDIETSGLYPERHGIWQIGALELENPSNVFLEEGRIDVEDEIAQEALKVIGKEEKYLRDSSKQSQKKLMESFFKWVKTVKMLSVLCQNPQFDLNFVNFKARKYGLNSPLHHRSFDLHSISSLRYYQFNNTFLIEKDHSSMGLSNILRFCGLKDKREAHNALDDARLTGECFSRILYGKSLFREYTHCQIPEELAQ